MVDDRGLNQPLRQAPWQRRHEDMAGEEKTVQVGITLTFCFSFSQRGLGRGRV
jgi:hypothetical protein